MKTVALIGDPVAQSPSPAIHRAAFQATGLDYTYVAERMTREELPGAFESLRDRFVGLNVTRPLKEAIVPLLDEVSGDAVATGSVNTVAFADGAAIGESTDGAGFLKALQRSGAPAPTSALILGSGGSARAVGRALLDAGAEVVMAARNPERGSAAAEAVGGAAIPLEAEAVATALKAADLLVNTIPIGDRLTLPQGVRLRAGMTVFDLVYTPTNTALLEAATDAGCRPVGGLTMLLEQAALSFEIWTGKPAPMEVMQRAGYLAINERTRV
jgi:shikimate dehydrogenase